MVRIFILFEKPLVFSRYPLVYHNFHLTALSNQTNRSMDKWHMNINISALRLHRTNSSTSYPRFTMTSVNGKCSLYTTDFANKRQRATQVTRNPAARKMDPRETYRSCVRVGRRETCHVRFWPELRYDCGTAPRAAAPQRLTRARGTNC